MPELFRLSDLHFTVVYAKDNRPKYVHVTNADGEARFSVKPIELVDNTGLSDQDILRVKRLLTKMKSSVKTGGKIFIK